jgi:aminopeptidase N
MRTRSRFAFGSAATGLAAVLFASTAFAAGTPGAPGIGDPYFPSDGNGGYDALHYNIRLNYQPITDRLQGTTTIVARTTQELSQFNLDFLLKVKQVRVNNAPAQYAQQDGELVVRPAKDLPNGSDLTVVVSYDDVPSTYAVDGATAWKWRSTGTIATGQPGIAQWWYPSNNHPLDKATFDVSVAVPDGVEAISNGVLVDRQQQINGWVRWNWRSIRPQTTYNTTLAVGQYELRQQTTPNGQPFITAYDENIPSANAAAARASVERTPEIIEHHEQFFGPYPFEAQGGVVNTVGTGAVETQTRPVYGDVFFRRGANTYVMAHLLSEQWFGNSVSTARWQDNVLKEGFASYARYLWSEYQGEGTPAELAQYNYDRLPADDPFWTIKPADPGAADILHTAVYDRGAMSLQALRTEIGDAAFFTILQGWPTTKRYGNATAEDFIAYAEQVSGRQLDALFHTWWYTSGKPATGPNGALATGRSTGQAEPKSFRQIDETTRLLAGR